MRPSRGTLKFMHSHRLHTASTLKRGRNKFVGCAASYAVQPNPAVDPVPFGHWTLRDEAAQRRSPLRWAS
jgi:hypothetical protein